MNAAIPGRTRKSTIIHTCISKAFVITFLFALLGIPAAWAQNNYVQITPLAAGSNVGTNIFQIDDDGNAYVLISNPEGPVYGQTYHRNGGGSNWGVVLKVNANGNLMWANPISTADGNNDIYDLQVDKNRNVYISGAGSGILTKDGVLPNGGGFLLKLDKNGNRLWAISTGNLNGATIAGQIALAPDGVYWNAMFYGQLKMQGYTVNSNNPNMGTPDALVLKVSEEGNVTSLYHDPAKSSIIQLLVASDNGNATAVVMRGDYRRYRVLLDNNCHVISDQDFISYGDFPERLQTTLNGYEFATSLFDYTPTGPISKGFYDVKFDKQLNITSSTQLAAVKYDNYNWPIPDIIEGINYNDNGFFLERVTDNSYLRKTWEVFKDGESDVLPKETDDFTNISRGDVYTRNFIKVVGDTLNMLMRHYDVFTTQFNFYGQHFDTGNNNQQTFFWVKYIYAEPDNCNKISAAVIQNGVEGSKDVEVEFKLPDTCPAAKDIVINLQEADPSANKNDFTIPAQAVIKQGETKTTVTINVLNDDLIEQTESFIAKLSIADPTSGYAIKSSTSQLKFSIDDDDNTTANRQYTITYSPQITEGGSGYISVSLPANKTLDAPLTFTFAKDATDHQATPTADYTPINITLPANTNSTNFTVDAVIDNLLEGDEFITGELTPTNSPYGAFTSPNDQLKIKIIDVDNTEGNRIIDVSPDDDQLNEGKFLIYSFKLAEPKMLQDLLAINTTRANWFDMLVQTDNNIVIGDNNTSAVTRVTYPEDNVVSDDRKVSLKLSASNPYLGSFRFRWKGQIVDELIINAIDNDLANASLKIDPLKLTIPEGKSNQVEISSLGNLTFEHDVSIPFVWQGAGIDAEDRIATKSGTIILPKGQQSVVFPVSIADNNTVDKNNDRLISFTQPVYNLLPLPVTPQKFIAVTIVDDDFSVPGIPSAFTPNGDGINDTWLIANLASDTRCTVKVYTRSGEMVYSSIGYPIPWDGQLNGKALPVGTYYYVIVSTGKTYSGSVVIIR